LAAAATSTTSLPLLDSLKSESALMRQVLLLIREIVDWWLDPP
jgi:hypothetical protein